MIAPDFLCLWVHATESIAAALVEEARAHRHKKDKQGRITYRDIRARPRRGVIGLSMRYNRLYVPGGGF